MANYQSKYTGKQIDEAVGNATKVVANPADAGTAELESIEIAGDVYNISKTQLYEHHIFLRLSSDENAKLTASFCLISTVKESFADLKSVVVHFLGEERNHFTTASGQYLRIDEHTAYNRTFVTTLSSIHLDYDDSSDEVTLHLDGNLVVYQTETVQVGLGGSVDVTFIQNTQDYDSVFVDATNISISDNVRPIH